MSEQTDFVVTIHFHDTANRHEADSVTLLINAVDRRAATERAWEVHQEEGVSEVEALTFAEFEADYGPDPTYLFPRLG